MLLAKRDEYRRARRVVASCLKRIDDLVSKMTVTLPQKRPADKILHQHRDTLLPAVNNTIGKIHVLQRDVEELITVAERCGVRYKTRRRRYHWNGYDSIIHLVSCSLTYIEESVDLFFTQPSNASLKTLNNAIHIHGERILTDIARLASVAVTLAQTQATKNSMFEQNKKIEEEQYETIDAIDRSNFFGKDVGYYLLPSLKSFVQTLTKALASYKYGSENGHSLMRSVSAYMYYIYDPNSAATTFTETTSDVDLEFLQSFWNLFDSSIMKHYFVLTEPSLAVDVVVDVYVSDEEVDDVVVSLFSQSYGSGYDFMRSSHDYGGRHIVDFDDEDEAYDYNKQQTQSIVYEKEEEEEEVEEEEEEEDKGSEM
eukprot:m.106988 g.106988  ORF g.106988 m.106988 type:complete len:369 (-) comp12683_c4_seq1:36-1142(-)